MRQVVSTTIMSLDIGKKIIHGVVSRTVCVALGFTHLIKSRLKMLSRPHRRVIIVILACYFTSKIIIAIQKLQDEKIGTVFNKINKDVVEVESCNSVFVYDFVFVQGEPKLTK